MSFGQPRFEAALLRPFDARQLLGQATPFTVAVRSPLTSTLFLFFFHPFLHHPADHRLIPYWNTVMNLAEWTMVLLRPKPDASPPEGLITILRDH